MDTIKEQGTKLASKLYNPYIIGLIILVIIIFLYWNGYFVSSTTTAENAKSKPKKGNKAMEEHDTANGDADKFIASGGRSDSNGEDAGLIDRIHAINKAQMDYVRGAKNTYKYDAREDATPAVYSPEEDLQQGLYAEPI